MLGWHWDAPHTRTAVAFGGSPQTEGEKDELRVRTHTGALPPGVCRSGEPRRSPGALNPAHPGTSPALSPCPPFPRLSHGGHRRLPPAPQHRLAPKTPPTESEPPRCPQTALVARGEPASACREPRTPRPPPEKGHKGGTASQPLPGGTTRVRRRAGFPFRGETRWAEPQTCSS